MQTALERIKGIESLSARRAWIEITPAVRSQFMRMSLSARRAWIEIIVTNKGISRFERSLSARRAWIEIHFGTPRR